MFQLHPQLKADTQDLGSMPLCKVLLMNDSQFPWLILVPRRVDIREVYELDEADRLSLQYESVAVSKLLMAHFKGDKLNVAALGNLVPQLHLHHIVRFENDAAWPKPVWGNIAAIPYDKPQLANLTASLEELLARNIAGFRPRQINS